MDKSNAAIRSTLAKTEASILNLERAVALGDVSDLTIRMLARLRDQRRALKLLLLNRRVEASKRVVDLAVWLRGAGALDQMGHKPS